MSNKNKQIVANTNVVKDAKIDKARSITMLQNGEILTTQRFLGLCKHESFRNRLVMAIEQLNDFESCSFEYQDIIFEVTIKL